MQEENKSTVYVDGISENSTMEVFQKDYVPGKYLSLNSKGESGVISVEKDMVRFLGTPKIVIVKSGYSGFADTVWSHNDQKKLYELQGKNMPKNIHKSRESALQEASRLASKAAGIGNVFYTLKAVDKVVAVIDVKTEQLGD